MIRHARPVRHEAPEGGSADPVLADVGHVQAQATAEYLVGEGIDHVVSSSMKRALQTAEPLADRLGLGVEMLDDLRESDHRNQLYVPAEEMDRDDPSVAHYFDPDRDLSDTIFSDGYDEFRTRVERGFEHVIRTNRSRTVAVLLPRAWSTGVYLQILLGIDDPLSLLIDYCGITRVAASSTGVRTVRSLNETHHVRHLLER